VSRRDHDDRLAGGLHAPRRDFLNQSRDAGGGGRLDPDTLQGESLLRGEDGFVWNGNDPSSGLTCGSQGFLGTGGATDSDRRGYRVRLFYRMTDNERRRTFSLDSEERGFRRPMKGVMLAETFPYRGDVAGVSDRQSQQVRRSSQGLDNLEDHGLLSFQPVGIQRIDECDR